MTNSSGHFKAGTRGSRLAWIQTRRALDQCERWLPDVLFDMVPVVTCGDRDRATDLRHSPADFFSRELDNALRSGDIDCALHSAKDLPEESPDGIDGFWLPWREDPRDAILLPEGVRTFPDGRFRVGVSSERREQYCRKRFPQARLLTVRGNIEERLAQLDGGRFDMLIMAAAALHRLDLNERIFSYISLAELPVPEGQGAIALTFRNGDTRFEALRNLLIYPVLLAGAGIGTVENTTQAVLQAVKECDVCLHDALMPAELLDHLPPRANRISVGKRSGRHSVSREQICNLLLTYARQGKHVLRLKGGDPVVFGRLAEEVDALKAAALPFRVLPGVGAFSVAASTTGILPSRRQTARGFCVMTPRQAGESGFVPLSPGERARLPQVLYMASRVIPALTHYYRKEGFAADTPAAVVFDAGSALEHVVTGTLATLGKQAASYHGDGPGLVIVGETARSPYLFRTGAPLEGKRILYGGSENGVGKCRHAVQRYGGRFVALPQIRLEIAARAHEVVKACPRYDDLVITSPSCARLFLRVCAEVALDVRAVPSIMVCGPGTARVFRDRGIYPEVVPEDSFGAEGLTRALDSVDLRGRMILRLRSDQADGSLAAALAERGAQVDDIEFYHNRQISCDVLPEADVVVFTSGSCVRAFLNNFGPHALSGRLVCAIGAPTATYLQESGVENVVIAKEATVEGCIGTVAGIQVAGRMTAGT